MKKKTTKFTILFLLLVLTLPTLIYINPVSAVSWDNHINIIIDSDLIDTTLSNFTILVHLSSSSGTGSDDLTPVFDELGSNSLKIQFLLGEIELYAEIEYWNATSEEAYIWVKVPSISSVSDTTITMNYDSDQSDNTGYIGVTGSAVVTNVWDEYYITVQHCADNSTSTVLDSTLAWNGTKKGVNEPTEFLGLLGPAQNYDGSDDYTNLGYVTYDETTNSITIESFVVLDTVAVADCVLGGTGAGYGATLGFSDSDTGDGGIRVGFTGYQDFYYAHGMPSDDTTWNYFAGTYDYQGDKYGRAYVNGSQIGATLHNADPTFGNGVRQRMMGASAIGTSGNLDGRVDEVRVSSVARSADWIEVSSLSGFDTLLDYAFDYAFELAESLSPIASLYTQKSLHFLLSETMSITSSLESIRGFVALLEETVAASISFDTVKAITRTLEGSVVVTTTFENQIHIVATLVEAFESIIISSSMGTTSSVSSITYATTGFVFGTIIIGIFLALIIGVPSAFFLFGRRRK